MARSLQGNGFTVGFSDRALERGIEIAETDYQSASWEKSRRIIVIRQSASDRESPGKES
jgi:hypothetical protein